MAMKDIDVAYESTCQEILEKVDNSNPSGDVLVTTFSNAITTKKQTLLSVEGKGSLLSLSLQASLRYQSSSYYFKVGDWVKVTIKVDGEVINEAKYTATDGTSNIMSLSVTRYICKPSELWTNTASANTQSGTMWIYTIDGGLNEASCSRMPSVNLNSTGRGISYILNPIHFDESVEVIYEAYVSHGKYSEGSVAKGGIAYILDEE